MNVTTFDEGSAGSTQFVPKVPQQIVRMADWTHAASGGKAKRIIVSQSGGSHAEVVSGDVEIAGPCRVRITRGRLEVIVNHDVPIRWTPAGRKSKKASSNSGAPR